jgi:hypothetical protein
MNWRRPYEGSIAMRMKVEVEAKVQAEEKVEVRFATPNS